MFWDELINYNKHEEALLLQLEKVLFTEIMCFMVSVWGNIPTFMIQRPNILYKSTEQCDIMYCKTSKVYTSFTVSRYFEGTENVQLYKL